MNKKLFFSVALLSAYTGVQAMLPRMAAAAVRTGSQRALCTRTCPLASVTQEIKALNAKIAEHTLELHQQEQVMRGEYSRQYLTACNQARILRLTIAQLRIKRAPLLETIRGACCGQ